MAEFGAAAFTADGDLTAAGGTVNVTAPATFLTATATFTSAVPPIGKRRRVVVTDIHGTTIGELENARLSGISYGLNQPESWSFQVPQNDVKAHLIMDIPFREIQVWRGDQLLAWGPAVRPAMNKDNFVVNCQGALWHLGRRFIGKADRTNWLANGDFEDGLAHWNFGYNPVLVAAGAENAQAVGPDGQSVTFPTLTGHRAMRLENFVDGADAFANQSFLFTVDTATSPDGDIWTMKGYVYVESLAEGTAAFDARGLYLERFSTTELNPDEFTQSVIPGAPLSLDHQFAPLDEEVPIGVWTRQECEFTVPPKAGEPEIIEVRLYAPNGVVYWDAIGLFLVEKLGFYGKDQTSEIAKGIVEHLQDAAYQKSDANIGTHCPPSGVLRNRVYIHSEHPGGLSSLEEFTSLDNGFDFDVVYTPTTRTFTTYYPRKGTLKAQFALELGVNIADFTWAYDGETAASSVIVLGTGDGSDREEGFAIDDSAFSEGLTLEQVFSAPPETTIDSLDNMAAERLITAKNPVSLEIVTTRAQPGEPDPVGLLWPGDEVPVLIDRHALQIDAIYRVVSVTINPDDTLNLSLNLRVDV